MGHQASALQWATNAPFRLLWGPHVNSHFAVVASTSFLLSQARMGHFTYSVEMWLRVGISRYTQAIAKAIGNAMLSVVSFHFALSGHLLRLWRRQNSAPCVLQSPAMIPSAVDCQDIHARPCES